MPFDRGARLQFDLESELGCEADCPHHPYRILAHPEFGLTDGPNQSGAQVLDSCGIVDYLKALRIVEERVDRKVPAEGIFLRGSESIVQPDHRILRVHFLAAPAEGRNLDILSAEENVYQAKPPADQS